MAKLIWDADGQRWFQMGVSKGVLYVKKEKVDEDGKAYENGVVWNGLTAVTDSPDGAEANDLWADNIKYASLRSTEDYGMTIEAYTYPDEWGVCDGSATPATGVSIAQQKRRAFGFCWQTVVGNDSDNEAGYIIHIVWNATANPSERNYETINDSPDAITFSWECDTVPTNVEDYKATAHMEIDSTKADPAKLATLEGMLYGGDDSEATLPTPDDIIKIFAVSEP